VRGTRTANRKRDEAARLAALHRFDMLDTPPEEAFDRVARIAQSALKTPYVLISLVDESRQWVKSMRGLDIAEIPRDVSFCTHAIEGDGPFIVEDVLRDGRFDRNPLVTGDAHVRFYAGAPLVTPDGHAIGALCAMDRVPRGLSAAKTALLRDLASLVVDTLELQRIASTDALTGLLTRRCFRLASERELERARRFGRPAALVAFDIDHFKRIDDAHGHAAGGTVLQALAGICRPVLRAIDLFSRSGGEAFIILLPETGRVGAMEVAERMRQIIANTAILFEGHKLRITSSFGVTVFGHGDETIDAAFDRADDALDHARNTGRNRVVFSGVEAGLPSVA